MKKGISILSIIALLATVACDTSSKGTTTQIAQAPQATTAPIAAVTDSVVTGQPTKGYSKKKMQMQMMEMAPADKAEMLRKPDEVRVKKQ